MSATTTRTVEGHRIRLTSLDREVYPDTGVTKADVLDYVEAVAPCLTWYTRDRPATRKRWMKGVGTAEDPGDSFFHKNLEDDAPSWIRSYAIRHEDHTNRYPVLDDAATLVWFAQRGTLEFHVPQWRFRTGGRHEPPDRLVLDLDPGEGAGLAECVRVARLARDLLDAEGLPSAPVTSGSKGIHLYAPLNGSIDVDGANDLAHRLASRLEDDRADLVTANLRRERRRGHVLVDWSQNNGAKTTVAPFSPRGRPGATAAVPRHWDELDDSLEQLTLAEARERCERGDDPLRALLDG
ncbi:non-homologous end-joining DNA ligase [Demequina sp. NBRC 110053]|uniref:non-homologous end-joining DNA ligase n=1 Tax=Demequina sp. NBRC 110053 TaxID=1570342 RepID=UPI0009FCBDD6|nr:non-homologous end-joining DNA ligase [Demequina sp. NBRC 110053]